MKFIKLFLVTLVITGLFSCSKSSDTDTGSGSIAAKTELNVAYGADPQQRMDIYLPANRSSATTKVLIYIHGGAWVIGDKSELTAARLDTLQKRIPDYAVFSLNYRLAALPSTNPFPTQELDIKAAVEFIFGNRTNYQISDKFVLMGGSAGGHLSSLQAYKYQSPVKIKAVIDLCGPTDMVAMYNDYSINPSGQLGIAALMSGTPATNPTLYAQSSPLTFVTSANACPTIIFQGSADLVVNATTQSLALKNKLTTAGVTNEYYLYNGLGHVDTWNDATYTDAFNKIQVFLAANVQ